MKGNLKKLFSILLAVMVVSMSGCASAKAPAETPAEAPAVETGPDYSDQLYIFVTPAIQDTLYIDHDIRTFEAWGKARGVQTRVIGPVQFDDVALAGFIEQAIAQNPDGLLVNAVSDVVAEPINAAVEAGIPVVLVDGDANCKKDGWVGTDWYTVGQMEAQIIYEKLGGKGSCVYMGPFGVNDIERGFEGFVDYMEEHPGVEILGSYDGEANIEKSAEVVHNIITAYPDIDAIAGFGYPTAVGIASAIKELDLGGKIVAVNSDWTPDLIDAVREGNLTALVGQKRDLFTFYGAEFVFNEANRVISLSPDYDLDLGTIPYHVDCGTLVIDSSNVDQFNK